MANDKLENPFEEFYLCIRLLIDEILLKFFKES